jgi:MFS transporter, PPP family, 3-phenylpropionic acid transporter
LPKLITLRAYFFFVFGVAGLYVPYFPSWLRGQGFGGSELSAFLCLMPISALLTPVTLGIISDKLGIRGRLITLAALVSTAGVFGLTWVANLEGALPFVPALAMVSLFALGRAPMLSLGDVMAMETDPEYGRTRLWGSIGFVSSSLLGGLLVDTNDPAELPGSIFVCHMIAIGLSLALPKVASLPPRPALHDASVLLKSRRFQSFLIMSCFAYGALAAYDFASTFRMRELGASGDLVGLFWATATTTEVLLMFFGSRLTLRVPGERLLPWILVLGALRWFFMAEVQVPWFLVLIQPTHAVVFGLFLLSSVDMLKRAARGRGLGTAQGLLSVGSSIGSTAGFLAFGPLYAAFGSKPVFQVASALSLLAAVAAWMSQRSSRTADFGLGPVDSHLDVTLERTRLEP